MRHTEMMAISPNRTAPLAFHKFLNQLTTLCTPCTMRNNPSLTNSCACACVCSKPCPVKSKRSATAWLSCSFFSRNSSMSSPHSPVLCLTMSRFISMSSRPFIISCDANLPCRPNTSLITAPASCELVPTVLSWWATNLIASPMSICLVANLCAKSSASMPMPRKLSLVLVVMLRNRAEACLMASRPCSLKMPERVC